MNRYKLSPPITMLAPTPEVLAQHDTAYHQAIQSTCNNLSQSLSGAKCLSFSQSRAFPHPAIDSQHSRLAQTPASPPPAVTALAAVAVAACAAFAAACSAAMKATTTCCLGAMLGVGSTAQLCGSRGSTWYTTRLGPNSCFSLAANLFVVRQRGRQVVVWRVSCSNTQPQP